jgi:hypothetical protein
MSSVLSDLLCNRSTEVGGNAAKAVEINPLGHQKIKKNQFLTP